MTTRPVEDRIAEMIVLEKVGSTAHLILNRPEKGNALPFAALAHLVDLLHDCEDDDEVKVIVLRGRGRSFCVGDDYDDITAAYGHATKPGRSRRGPASAGGWPSTGSSGGPSTPSSTRPNRSSPRCTATAWASACSSSRWPTWPCAPTTPASATPSSASAWPATRSTWPTSSCCTARRRPGAVAAGRAVRRSPGRGARSGQPFGVLEELDATVADWVERISRNAKDALVMGKAAHNMALAQLGIGGYVHAGMAAHALATNIKYDPDDYNFFRERRDRGTRGAFEAREQFHDR
ncbi:MAG: enoyl-CoA hydratase/isomerase family protein [Acidimicrobiales bacterium]